MDNIANNASTNFLGETLSRIRTTNDRLRFNTDILKAFYERMGLPIDSKILQKTTDPQPAPGISQAIVKELETQNMLLNEQEDLLNILSQIA